MIIKTLAELAEPDEASLVIRPLDIDPARVAEGVAEYRQSLVAGFELVDEVPESTRNGYERVRTIYSYGVLCYELYTVAGHQARLVVEQALRDRFLPFYDGKLTFVDKANVEHEVTIERFNDLHNRDIPSSRGAGGSSFRVDVSRSDSTGCWPRSWSGLVRKPAGWSARSVAGPVPCAVQERYGTLLLPLGDAR